jgi:hypothetical protein
MDTFTTAFLKGLGNFTSFALVFQCYTSYLKYMHQKNLSDSPLSDKNVPENGENDGNGENGGGNDGNGAENHHGNIDYSMLFD